MNIWCTSTECPNIVWISLHTKCIHIISCIIQWQEATRMRVQWCHLLINTHLCFCGFEYFFSHSSRHFSLCHFSTSINFSKSGRVINHCRWSCALCILHKVGLWTFQHSVPFPHALHSRIILGINAMASSDEANWDITKRRPHFKYGSSISYNSTFNMFPGSCSSTTDDRSKERHRMNLNTEEYELLGDSKYRAYIAQVEKALRNFESTSEWADLIAALGKLNKVRSHPSMVAVGCFRVLTWKIVQHNSCISLETFALHSFPA